MNIGIEGQRLFRKKKHGMDMVALELIKNLQVLDQENQYYIFVKPDEDSSVLKETSNFKIVELKGGSYPTWEQFILPKAAKKYNCDLLHCTSNTAPLFSDIPLITTLHDIIYLERKSFRILTSNATRYQKLGNMYRKLVVPYVVKRSKQIITVSDFEIKQISYFFGYSGNSKLTSIYNGVSEHFKIVSDDAELNRLKEKYNLPEKFIFFLGNTSPKKNTKGTLKAFSRFIKETNSDYKLVISDYALDNLEKLLADIGHQELINHIVLTDYVVNTDLPAIYTQSSLFLYTSLRESFGIPIMEAMACGVPVITSNTSSMPEVAGDAAHLVNPFEPEDIAKAMIKVLADEEYRKRLINKGLERSKVFSWKNMAAQVLNLYNKTYEEIKA
ncbi:glycosyltransferase family 4 protein [Seonamhaeicola sp. MEBiC1930]|uniref:glycosyltransferase family 4 protein n=1 Tax=Seonamhaeicola sp. MEBiC01930 TaxID=2976768 RepID=UPI00324AAEEC